MSTSLRFAEQLRELAVPVKRLMTTVVPCRRAIPLSHIR
jgi:hypothetical protein